VELSRAVSTAAAALAAALFVLGCGAGKSPAPSEPTSRTAFVGLVSDDAFAARGIQRVRILRRQTAAGVRLLRQTFDWASIERSPGHYDFSVYDDYVAATARAGIQVLPVLFDPPAFHSRARKPGDDTPPPSSPASMARFAQALVHRYGPEGTLWRDRAELPPRPIRAWQIWNEPNVPAYWGGRPSARGYARLLERVGAAIKHVDPKAMIVTGGIPNSGLGIGFEPYVRALARAGAGRAFDALAIHPYARGPAGVLAAVAGARRLLASVGNDSAKLWVTEFGWASDGPGSAFTVGPAAQASNARTVIAALAEHARALRLEGVVYYNWRDAKPYPGGKDFWGLHTGLLRKDGRPKPALAAFAAAAAQLPDDRR
jgi:hypothetical protein